MLVSVPQLRQTTFGVSDLEEILHILETRSGSQDRHLHPCGVRCSKLLKMFASRACRISTMIGDPLDKGTMKKIVNSLSCLEQPWNCPHGRPTLRHLYTL